MSETLIKQLRLNLFMNPDLRDPENKSYREGYEDGLNDMASEFIGAVRVQPQSPVAWTYRTYDAENDVVHYNFTDSMEFAKEHDQFAVPLFTHQAFTAPEKVK